MNIGAKTGALIVFLQARQCALFVMWLTNVTMQSCPFSEVGRLVMKSIPILCQRPLVIGSGCRRPMGLLLRWLVQWHESQPATYRCVSRHICFQKYRSFMRKYVWSAPKCPLAGVSWASWRICRCIIFGIHNRSLFSAFPSSSFTLALTVISTSSSSSFFFASAFFSTCFFFKSPCSYSRPFSSKYYHCVDTHRLRSLVDAVDGGGRGLGLAKECAIDLNHLSSTMPALISSIHSPAAVTSRATKLHLSQQKFRRRDNMSATWFLTPGMCFTSQSKLCRTVRISICRTVRWSCVRVQRKVAWSVCTINGCSAPCMLNFQYYITSRMPNSSLSSAGYHISASCNLRLK